jgi:hypothetical protein
MSGAEARSRNLSVSFDGVLAKSRHSEADPIAAIPVTSHLIRGPASFQPLRMLEGSAKIQVISTLIGIEHGCSVRRMSPEKAHSVR